MAGCGPTKCSLPVWCIRSLLVSYVRAARQGQAADRQVRRLHVLPHRAGLLLPPPRRVQVYVTNTPWQTIGHVYMHLLITCTSTTLFPSRVFPYGHVILEASNARTDHLTISHPSAVCPLQITARSPSPCRRGSWTSTSRLTPSCRSRNT